MAEFDSEKDGIEVGEDNIGFGKWIDFGGLYDDYDESGESFVSKKLNKPGTIIEVNGENILIGDVNENGGTCNCCSILEPGFNEIVTRYKIIFNNNK